MLPLIPPPRASLVGEEETLLLRVCRRAALGAFGFLDAVRAEFLPLLAMQSLIVRLLRACDRFGAMRLLGFLGGGSGRRRRGRSGCRGLRERRAGKEQR